MTPAVPRPGSDAGRTGAGVGLVMTVLAVAAALSTPLMGLPDEPAHAVHAVAVVHGEVVGDDAVQADAASGWTRTETTVEVPAAYAVLPEQPTCFAFRPQVPASCAPDLPEAPGPPREAVTTVGTYAPAWYAVVGWPSLVLPPAPALYAMRVVAALLAAVLLGTAGVAIRRLGAGRVGLLGLAAAVPPVAVHLAGGINPSGTEVAASIALWSTSAVLVAVTPTRSDVLRWVVAGTVVAVTRPLGPALALGIPVLTLLTVGGGRFAGRRAGEWRTVAGAAVVAVAAAGALAWSVWRGTLSAFSGFPAPELGLGEVVRRSLGLVPERLVEMVGVIGWSDVGLPAGLVALWLAVVLALVAMAIVRGAGAGRWWLLVIGVGVVLLPVLADVRSAAQIGFVWQGRYTLPLAVGLPVLAGILVGRGWTSAPRDRGRVLTAAALLAAIHVVALGLSLRRFLVGSDAPPGGALAATTDVGVPAGLVLAVVAVTLAGALFAHATAERGGTARDGSGEPGGHG